MPKKDLSSIFQQLSLKPQKLLHRSKKLPTPKPKSLTSFHIFSDFPPEIQLMIFEEVEQEPRSVIVTTYVTLTIIQNKRGTKRATRHLAKGVCTIPSLLHVNRLARECAFKTYTLSFGRQLSGRPVYFDFGKDTLHFVDPLAFQVFAREAGTQNFRDDVESKLQWMAIGGAAHSVGKKSQTWDRVGRRTMKKIYHWEGPLRWLGLESRARWGFRKKGCRGIKGLILANWWSKKWKEYLRKRDESKDVKVEAPIWYVPAQLVYSIALRVHLLIQNRYAGWVDDRC